MELGDFLLVLRRSWKSCAAVVVAVLAVAAALSLVLPKRFTATAQVFVTVMVSDSAGELQSGATYTQTQVESFTKVATTPLVLDPVADDLGLSAEDKESLADDVSASAAVGTSIMVISAERADPESAAAVANAVANSLVAAVDELVPDTREGERLVRGSVIAAAEVPKTQSFPSKRNFLIVGFAAGLLLGVGQALLRHRLDKRIRDSSQVQELTSAPIMGRIALDPQMVGSKRPATVSRLTAEDYRRLRTNMQFVGSADENHGKTLVITSAVPGEGKSAISLNLATVLAEAGEKVLLIDGDLRRPRIAQYMGLESSVGLTTVLIGWATPGEVLQSSRVANLTVLPSGVIPPNPSELLASRAMKQLLDSAATHFDYTVVDCAPLLAATDAAVLSRQTDGALLVTDMQQATIPQFALALEEVERANGTVLGIVLNKMRVGKSSSYSYYGYQDYGDGAGGKGAARGAAHGATAGATR
ncbi:MAG: polysaccharide biosynthesis tyrosine autokinase [Bifidobacteriaceae bacterium]|nr:polysaccharide biosynthesis tyrosine autokinase [Bifidobacteriaceae bacterium]